MLHVLPHAFNVSNTNIKLIKCSQLMLLNNKSKQSKRIFWYKVSHLKTENPKLMKLSLTSLKNHFKMQSVLVSELAIVNMICVNFRKL